MSEIKVDNLTGKTSAGDITVTSEGGAATQSLQQGLAKAWINFNGTGTPASRKTLNSSSITDSGIGQYRVAIVSAMQDADFALLGSCIGDGTSNNRTMALAASRGSNTSSVMDVNTARANTETEIDWTHISLATFGDLA